MFFNKFLICFCLLIQLIGFNVFSKSDVYKRNITVEWEPVVGSHSYEIDVYEFQSTSETFPVGKFKVESTSWTYDLTPGKYQFKIRSVDSRGVPGVWGPYTPFNVWAPSPSLNSPKDNENINALQEGDFLVKFSWNEVLGAKSYLLEVYDEKQVLVTSREQQEVSVSIKLPVANKYSWRVYTLDVEKHKSEENLQNKSFVIWGPKMQAPIIDKPEDEFVTKINWSKPAHLKNFAYSLTRFSKTKKWERVEKNLESIENFIDVKNSWGGLYRLTMKAQGKYRKDSNVVRIEFPLYEGDKSSKSIEEAKLKKVLENDKDKYFLASYIISSLDYFGQNKEKGSQISYKVLTGTGRVGYSYTPKGRWGYLAIIDLGGVILNQKNYTFSSVEVQALWRNFLSSSSQIGISMGLFARELPEATFEETSEGTTGLQVKNVSQLGPLLGLSYRRSINYKMGWQLFTQINIGVSKISTPNKKPISSNVSHQIGALTFYKISKNMTGFAGLSYRLDKVSYQAVPYDGGTDLNFATEGDINTVEMKGIYVNLNLELGF